MLLVSTHVPPLKGSFTKHFEGGEIVVQGFVTDFVIEYSESVRLNVFAHIEIARVYEVHMQMSVNK